MRLWVHLWVCGPSMDPSMGLRSIYGSMYGSEVHLWVYAPIYGSEPHLWVNLWV